MSFFYNSPDAREAAQKIAAILAALEASTGTIVKGVELREIEVTTIESNGREMQMQVEIELERIPGQHWGQSA